MKYFSILFLLVTSVSFSNAQDFQFTKNQPQSTKFITGENEIYVIDSALNVSDSKKTLRWTSEIIYKPTAWVGLQICDKNLCYTPNIKTRTIDLVPGESTQLKGSMFPNDFDSCALVRMTIRLDGNEVADDSTYYIFESSTGSCALAGAKKVEKVNQLAVYPNPASGYIILNNDAPVYNVRIFSTNGLILTKYDIYNRNIIDISSLAGGTYFLVYEFHNGQTGLSQFIKL
jgi:hypothetical protein